MDRRSIISLALVGLLVSGAVAVLLLTEMDPSSNPEILTDAVGNELSFGEVPETIVSTNPSTTETLFAMGIGDQVIGVSSYCDYPEEVVERVEATKNGTVQEGLEMEIIGSYTTPNQEKIVSMAPDLVVVIGSLSSHISVAEKLNAMGIRTIVLFDGKSFEEVYQNIRIVGAVMRMNDTAEALIDDLSERMTALEDALQDSGSPKVLVSLSVGNSPWVCGNGSFLHQVINDGGGTNIFSDPVTSDLGEWFQVNKEVILDRNPDVLIITADHLGSSTDFQDFLDSINNDPVWGNTNAVKDGNVHLLFGQANNVFCRPGPRVVEATYLMAEILHPEIFDVQLPVGIGDEYQEYLVDLRA